MTPKTLFIENQHQVDDFCSRLATCNEIAIDTEFVRQNTFFPIPSILQIATENQAVAIDLTLSLDLKKLGKTLSKMDTIVIHACRQDLEVFKQVFGTCDFNFFDTQIAEMFLGQDAPPSYSNLVLKYFDKVISKNLQYSNWLVRPLKKSQIDYALTDVEYLLEIHRIQSKALKKQDKFGFFAEEFTTQMQSFKNSETETDASKFYNHIRSAEHLYIVDFICKQRLQKAIKTNKPKSHVLHDEKIVKLILGFTKDKTFISEILEEIGHSDKIKFDEDAYKIAFLKIKNHHLACRKIDPATIKKLQALLAKVAEKELISKQLIASRADLISLLVDRDNSKIMKRWRYNIFGKIATNALDSNS